MTANGSHAAGDAIDDAIASLTAAAEQASRLAAAKRNEYEAALDKARRLQKALDALQPKPAAKAKTPISAERVAVVRNLINRVDGDEFTATDLVNLHGPGIVVGTVVKALEQLRADEEIRLVRTGRGGSKIHALMP